MTESTIISTNDLNLWYSGKHALQSVTMAIPKNRVTALIGPSGCGKSTLLRCFNRLNDLIESVRIIGKLFGHFLGLLCKSLFLAECKLTVKCFLSKVQLTLG